MCAFLIDLRHEYPALKNEQSAEKFELHKQYIIEYTICEKGAILREKYKNYTKIVLTNYAGFGNILSTDNKDIHSFKGAMI